MAPTVDLSTANLANNATSIVITGTGFNTTAANNTVTFTNGAIGTVASATATQLNVNLTTPPTTTGSLTVVVTTSSISSGSPVQVATVVATATSPRVSIPDLLAASDDGVSNSDNITSIQTPVFTGTGPVGTTIELIDQANNLLGTTTSDGSGNWTITSSTLNSGSYSIKARYFSTTYSMTQLTGAAGSANIPAAITIAPGDRLYSPRAPSEDGFYRDLPDAASSGNSLTDTWNDLVAAYNVAKGLYDWGDFPGDSFEVTLTGPSYRGNNITYVVAEGNYATPRGSGRQLDSGDWIIALTNDLDGDSAGSSITTTAPNVIPSSYLLSSSALNISIIPTITSATYDATTGVLSVTGTNFAATGGSANDIDVSKLTITGEGGSTYTLTDSTDVEITSSTAFAVTLSATDKAALNQIFNKNGTASTSSTTYNLAAANNWNPANTDAADLTGNGITVSNVAIPAITSATYDSSTGTLVVTGTGFLKFNGATNDIDVSKLTITGQAGGTRTLTSTSVEITSGTSFSLTLNSADQTALLGLLNNNGTSPLDSTTYNLAAAEDWAAGANASVVVADLTGNGITVSNYTLPLTPTPEPEPEPEPTPTPTPTPTALSLSISSFNENIAAGTAVATLSSLDPDASNTFTYSLITGDGSTDNAAFTIAGDQLKITASPDFEAKSSYAIRLRTTDQGGLSFDRQVTLAVSNVNETATALNLSISSFNENIAAGAAIATLSSLDPDASNTFTSVSYTHLTLPTKRIV